MTQTHARCCKRWGTCETKALLHLGTVIPWPFLDSKVAVLENVKGFLRAIDNFKVFLKKNCPEQPG